PGCPPPPACSGRPRRTTSLSGTTRPGRRSGKSFAYGCRSCGPSRSSSRSSSAVKRCGRERRSRRSCHTTRTTSSQRCTRAAPGTWNRMEYRPLEGFVFAVTPFNFTAIGGNLPSSAALMGNTVVWKPASTAAYSAHFLMKLFEAAGLPPGVINLVYGSGSEIGDPALASPDLAGVHFTGSTPVFQGMWKTIGANIPNYRNYPRIVGETGGQDFIVAHPSADAAAVATAIVRGSFEYQGRKCSAASRIFAPSNLWPEIRERVVAEVKTIKMGDVSDFGNFMGAVIDAGSFKTQKQAI